MADEPVASTSKGKGKEKAKSNKGEAKSTRGGLAGRGRLSGFSGAGPQTLRSTALLGSFSREDILKSAKESPIYPERQSTPSVFANQLEYDAYRADKQLLRKLKASPYYVQAPDVGKTPYDTYSSRCDRLKKTATPDFASLDTKKLLNPDFFPTELWDMIFEPKKTAGKRKKKARPKVNIDQLAAGAENATKEDDELYRAGSDDEQDNMTASEDEGGNDYEQQYFDNGEDEDEGAGADDAGEEGVLE